MKYLLPLWILINCRLTGVSGVFEWTVIRKVTDYGQNVTLFCNVSNCCPQDSGWDRYSPEQRTLFIDLKKGRANKKYDGEVSGDGYTLIIQNLTKSDLNVSYACVYGATIGTIKDLLEEDVFKYIHSTHPNVSTGESKFSEGEIAGFIAGPTVTIVVLLLMCKIVPKINRYRNRNRDRGRDRGRDNNDLEEDVRLVEVNHWPDLSKRSQIVKKSDIKQCSKELYTKICESRQVYHMTGKKKGKLLLISNVQCADQSTEAKSTDETLAKDQSCVETCRSCVDFDLTDINQLFKHMEYEAKNADTKRKVSGEEIKKFLGEQLGAEDNKSYDSLVIVFFSGGLGYEPAHIYDIDGNEVPTKEIFDMIRKSTAFKDKPKIVILRTYDFTKETKNYDVRDAEKTSLNFINQEPNEDDLFVVSSQLKTKNRPWIIGDQMNGSYFIQALIDVFKNMAHEKSFMEMMEEVNKCLSSAMVPGQKKNPVAEVMILEHSKKKGLFFFPGLKDIPEVQRKSWPDLLKGLPYLNKRDIVKCTEDLRTKICKSKHGKVYHLTGKKKGKVLTISNVQCSDQSIEAKAVNRCRRCVDFDKTSLSQLFTYMQYETKQSYTKRDVSEEEMKTFLATQLENEDNSTFDSLIIVFYSDGMEFKPDCIYDTNGKEIDKDGILEMIRQSKYFKDKPKIVIIRTYDFKEETETGDVLDAVSHELHFYKRPNKDDLFVVSSQPRTKKGPWIIGDGMNGSYFIQAIIQVFKKMAHEKSFMEMMVEVNNCLASANMPKKGKQAVAEVMVLEHSDDKDLFFYPGLKDLPMIVPEWPDLTAGGNNVQKKDVISSEWNFYTKIKNEEIYSMTSANRGKFIFISNVQCIPCLGSQNEEDKKEAERCAERYPECIRNSDFDKSNMSQLLKFMGYDFKDGDQVENLSKEEIKEFLKTKLEEIDNDTSSQYDSMAILFLSGEIKCEAAKIYDKEGVFIPRNEILNIVKECKHFKGKPKVIFVQTYSFQDKTEPLDQTDSTTNDIIKRGEPNTDDIFMVSSYPRIEQGPWIIGENMIGSYFIQALVHVFKNFAYKKSFMELLKEANICLDQTLIPKLTVDGKNSGTEEKKRVAQIVLLEYSEDKELYFFPGLEFEAPVDKGVEPVNLSTSMSGKPVTTAS